MIVVVDLLYYTCQKLIDKLPDNLCIKQYQTVSFWRCSLLRRFLFFE